LFSPVSSLVDLVGPLTWALDPNDFPAWCKALQEVMALPPTARAALSARGIAWARQFAWRKSAERHIALYREVAERHAGKRRGA
jgi:alpha-1,3-rhamnosyl/mannosyltransferase